MKRIFVFDAYGTLFKINSNNETLKSAVGKHFENFMDVYRNKLLTYSWLHTLMDEWKDFNELADLAINNTCLQFDINQGSIRKELISIYKTPQLYSDVVPVFKQLTNKDNFLNLLSNGKMSTLKTAASKNNIDQYLKNIFSSETIKKYKVHPLTYKQVIDYYQVEASSCIFISSNTWDIAGAANFGFKTVWLNRNNQDLEIISKSPDFIIHSLRELTEIS